MTSPPNWDQVRDEAVGLLRDLVRFDTTNPPGHETPAAEFVAARLREVGVEPVVVESEPGRGSAVGRLKSSGEAGPVLLMGHIDVVPAEPSMWTYPPFSATLADGFVWGRGALDMKSIVVAHLMVMRLLARQDVPLKRDVVQMASADEEIGGQLGAGFLVEKHPELVRAEYALNEGGGHEFPAGGKTFYSVQTAEKGLARFRLRVRGEPGHGSIPREDNAVTRLSEKIGRLGRTRLPLHVTRTMQTMLATLADGVPGMAEAIPAILNHATHVEALARLPLSESQRRSITAMLHNTATPTVLNAGTKVNVIPSLAEALVDGRTLPGFGRDEFLAEIAPVVGEDVEIEFLDDAPPLEADLGSPFYTTITDVMADYLPGARPIPTMLTGATDAKHIVKLGARVYGFAPLRHEVQVADLSLVHGHDERISVDNMLFMTQTLYDIVARFAAA